MCTTVALAVMATLFARPGASLAQDDVAVTPDWLEPRGLNVVELVGQVPEATLQGTIISYNDWQGIVVYESGTRTGDHVEITTTMYPRLNHVWWAANGLLTNFGCLGQAPHYDHMGSVVPPSTLRVYDSTGREVTSEILLLDITTMGMLQPSDGPQAVFRYPSVHYGPDSPYPLPLDADGLHLPANAGCWIRIPGADYYPLTGVFTFELSPPVYATALGTQTASFQSYIGVGSVGLFQGLMEQLRRTYGDRDGRVPLQIPAGANYFLLKFPPTPVDVYTDLTSSPGPLNVARPSGGTYRLSDGGWNLSSDMIFSAAFPLPVAWQDSDQATWSTFLPVLRNPPQLATPEYVVPAGVPYNSCFLTGNCEPAVLEQIYNTHMTLEIIYLRITPPASGEWIPVKMAGPAWNAAALDVAADAFLPTSVPITAENHVAVLPVVYRSTPTDPLPPPPAGCPCGWFDPLGRMLGLAP